MDELTTKSLKGFYTQIAFQVCSESIKLISTWLQKALSIYIHAYISIYIYTYIISAKYIFTRLTLKCLRQRWANFFCKGPYKYFRLQAIHGLCCICFLLSFLFPNHLRTILGFWAVQKQAMTTVCQHLVQDACINLCLSSFIISW